LGGQFKPVKSDQGAPAFAPIVNDNDALVQIHATSINQLDAKIKSGEFKLLLPYKFPLILGHDVAGVVTKVGSKVSRFKMGDEVFARPADFRIGTFAEYISINENDVALKPIVRNWFTD